eukprot:3659135-Amphidinium_carterae.2
MGDPEVAFLFHADGTGPWLVETNTGQEVLLPPAHWVARQHNGHVMDVDVNGEQPSRWLQQCITARVMLNPRVE